MTEYMYVTQEMWDRAQAALVKVLPHIEEQVPKLSTAGTMLSLRDQIRAAIVGTKPQWFEGADRQVIVPVLDHAFAPSEDPDLCRICRSTKASHRDVTSLNR